MLREKQFLYLNIDADAANSEMSMLRFPSEWPTRTLFFSMIQIK